MKQFIILFFSITFCMISFAQNDKQVDVSVYEKIMKEVAEYKIDTTAVPDDKLTRMVNELRSLNGVFNINEAIQFKIEEDKQKKDITPEEANIMSQYFTNGDGRRLLNNSIIWIYRDHFTLKEVNQMVKFYKTDAGKKLTMIQPVIIFKSLASAEIIGNSVKKQSLNKSF